MKKTNLLIFTLLSLIIALGVAIYLQYRPVQQQTVETAQPVLPPEPIKKPIIHYPVPKPVVVAQAPLEKPEKEQAKQALPLPEILPAIQDSDQSIQQSLENLLSGKPFYKLLFIENFIQRLVVTIDNLPEKRLARAHLPIKPPGGKFIVSGTAEAPQTSSRNNKRYSPYLSLIEAIDQDMALKVYVHFYPLFQSAYEQLGYQNAYFNDRLVFVLDHLLATPNPPDPILLAQPAVLYTYADPSLEKLSAGQKVLLRIGQDQRFRIIKILDSYHQRLKRLHP
jgi:hypothetical protein